MKKFAVIDVGSNSVRLLLVADGKVLYKRLHTTRLGEGLSSSPYLLPAAIERTALAVSDFVGQAKSEGAEEVFVFATAAVRTACNREEFLSRVRALCGVEIEVLSGEREAEIGLLGALGNADGGLIDIGGASTELVVRKSGKIVYKRSVDVGVVRLKDACGREEGAIIEKAKQAARAFGEVPKAKLTAIGGTATTLAAQYLGLQSYDSKKVTGAVLSSSAVQALADGFLKRSTEEIAALPCMPTGRADVITGGAILLSVLIEELGFDGVTVSDRDNLEGYAVWRGLME